MPIINGQKMACEPCIRGHRSTKCTHASERLMVPVRKPGRPLSTCPHPASSPCSCAAVTAAIPRKQACHCGPSKPINGLSEIKKEHVDSDGSCGANTPPSPSKSSNPPFKVTKSTSRSNSRKLSMDPAGLARMSSNQLNIIQSPTLPQAPGDAHSSNGNASEMYNLAPYGAPLGMTQPQNGASFSPVFQQPLPSPFTDAAKAALGEQENSTSTSKEAGGSCCGGGKSSPKEPVAPPSRNEAAIASGINGATKSCCSSTSAASSSGTNTATTNRAPSMLGMKPSSNGFMLPPPHPAVVMQNGGAYPFYQPPTIFNYPPQYGSYLQPLQPEQWRQIMSAIAYGQPMAPPMFGIPPGVPFQQPPGVQEQEQQQQPETWTSHQCTCGDGCQCVGCAAHPYNDATQSYVRSAWNSMMSEAPQSSTPRHNVATNGGDPKENGLGESSDLNSTIAAGNGDVTVSPPAPQTPSDATSGLAEEQTLSANDFFFVSYPFAEGCEGDMGSCPCGDDCQCIGCAIHGNTDTPIVPAESSL